MFRYAHINDVYITRKLKIALREIVNYPITTIVAPAGYGKSTAIKWWEENYKKYKSNSIVYRVNIISDDVNVAWDELCYLVEDNDPDFAEKLRKAGFPDSGHAMQLLGQLWRSREKENNKEVYLIIDDAHLLPKKPLVHVIMYFLNKLPENLHIILLSRKVIFNNSERIRFGHSFYNIKVDSFKLEADEIYMYARQCGVPLNEKDTKELAEFSDGWISLVYIAFCNFIRTGCWRFDTADIDQLIKDVMLEPMNTSIRDFLKICSVAPEFTEEQAVYLWGNEEARDFLKTLLHENAFIVRGNDGLYRFHQLLHRNTFREFEALPDEKRNLILERLGDWHYSKKEYLPAAMAYSKGNVWNKLLKTVAADRNSSFGGKHMPHIHEWYKNCPVEVLREHPDAILIFAIQHFVSGDISTMLKLNELLRNVVEENENLTIEEKNNFAGESEVLLAFLQFNNIEGMSRHHRIACQLMNRESLLVNNHSPWTFGSPSVLALYHREKGRLDEEINCMKECMPYYYKLTDYHGNGAEYCMEAETEFMRGNLENAEIAYLKAVRAAKRNNQHSILVTAEFIGMRIDFLAGNYRKASEHILSLRKILMDTTDYALLPTIDLCELWLFFMLGEENKIPPYILEDGMIDNFMGVSVPVILTVQGEALVITGKHLQLLSRYDEVNELCENNHMLLCSIYIRIQKVIALLKLKKNKEAESLLMEAVNMAEADNLILPFAEHEEQIRSLLTKLLYDGFNTEFTKKIIELGNRFNASRQKILVDNFGHAPDFGLSKREFEIAKLAAKRRSTKEIAEELHVSEHTVRNHLNHVFSKIGIEGSARNKREQLEKIWT